MPNPLWIPGDTGGDDVALRSGIIPIPYTVADVKIGYTKKKLAFIDSLKVSLEFTNIFDKGYVSEIKAMDDSRAGSTSYYVGAPFTTMLSVSLEI